MTAFAGGPTPLEPSLLALLEPLEELLPGCPTLQSLHVKVASRDCSLYNMRRVRALCGALSAAYPGKRVTFEWS